MSTLFLCGAGNPSGVRLAINVNRAIRKWDSIVILDDNPELKNHSVLGCIIRGGLSELVHANSASDKVTNMVASSTKVREKVKRQIGAYGGQFTRLIHPAVDCLGVTFDGDDITVYENATLGASSTIGDGCIVFMNAVVGHGAKMDGGSILGPGAVLNARVTLGKRAYFGTNASILPDLSIGTDATVGANSSVTINVADRTTYIGVPAHEYHVDDTSSAETRTGLDVKKVIKKCWQKILATDNFGSNDNFFTVGGSSRSALELAEEIRSSLGIPCLPIDIFRFPTIEKQVHGLCAGEMVSKDHRGFMQSKRRAYSRALARSHARAWAKQHQTPLN